MLEAMITEGLLPNLLRTSWFWTLLENLKLNWLWMKEMTFFHYLLFQLNLLNQLLLSLRLCPKQCRQHLCLHHLRQEPGGKNNWLTNQQVRQRPNSPRKTSCFQHKVNNH